MVAYTARYVGNRYIFKGKIAKCIGETDSGSVLLEVGGKEVWTDYRHIYHIDGLTAKFKVFDLPVAA